MRNKGINLDLLNGGEESQSKKAQKASKGQSHDFFGLELILFFVSYIERWGEGEGEDAEGSD